MRWDEAAAATSHGQLVVFVTGANDIARDLQMLLAGGDAPRVGCARREALRNGSHPARSTLPSAGFAFRYGEGWSVGPFGAAAGARWNLGNLASLAAWMVLLPESKQAVVVLIDASSELPLGEVNVVTSRLPIGVVNLVRKQAAPQGPSLHGANRRFDTVLAAALVALAALAWRAWRARAAWPGESPAVVAAAVLAALVATGPRPALLAAFARDVSLASAAAAALLCWPVAWRMGRSVIRRAAPP